MIMRSTPRRVSRRTIQRYSAIRRFFSRALGTISRSSTSVIVSEPSYSVHDLKHRILDLENKLSEVTKRYPNLSLSTDKDSPRTEKFLDKDSSKIEGHKSLVTECTRSSKNIDKFKDSQKSITLSSGPSKKNSNSVTDRSNFDESFNSSPRKSKKIKYIDSYDTDYESKNMSHKLPTHKKKYSTTQYPMSSCVYTEQISLDRDKKPSKHHQSKKKIRERSPIIKDRLCHEDDINYAHGERTLLESHVRKYKSPSPTRAAKMEKLEKQEKCSKLPKQRIDNKNTNADLDQTFISEIIRKQYRPVKLGRRKSDISQFSVPVCRDHEPRTKSKSANLCASCLVPVNLCVCKKHDMCDVASICDRKPYTCKSPTGLKNRSKHPKVYDDSALYDLVPVKEKPEHPSPLKLSFPEEDQTSTLYKEVPPSPRSHRPRLNLTANYSDYEEVQNIQADDKIGIPDCLDDLVTKLDSVNLITEHSNNAEIQPSSQVTKTELINKTEETLLEIKETLQQFLQNIKKDNSAQNLQDKSCTGVNSSCYLPKYPFGGSNFMQPVMSNSCYYPMPMPICPMNCMTNTLQSNCNCTVSKENVVKEPSQPENKAEKDNTVELIKEIYKCVAAKMETDAEPVKQENKQHNSEQPQTTKILTSRSVGSSRLSLCEADPAVAHPVAQSICRSSSIGTLNTKTTYNLYDNLSKQLYYSDTNLSVEDTVLPEYSVTRQSSSTATNIKKPGHKKMKKFLKFFNVLSNKKDKLIKKQESTESKFSKKDINTKRSQSSQYTENAGYAMYKNQNYSLHQTTSYESYQDNNLGPVYESLSERDMSTNSSYAAPTAPPYSMSFNHNSQKPSTLKKRIEVKNLDSTTPKVPLLQRVVKLIQQGTKFPGLEHMNNNGNNFAPLGLSPLPQFVPAPAILPQQFTAPSSPTQFASAGSPMPYTAPGSPMHFTAPGSPMQYTAPGSPTQFAKQRMMPSMNGGNKQMFDWSKLQPKMMPEMNNNNKLFQEASSKLQKHVAKNLSMRYKNPFSMKDMIKKALLTNPQQQMLYKPNGFF